MKTKNVVLYLLLACICFLPGRFFSQANLTKGDKYFDQNLFESAIKYYLLDTRSGNKKTAERAFQKLADCYRITGEFEKAEALYKKILNRKKKDPVNVMNYGLSLKNSAKFAEAVTQFLEYVRMKPDDPMAKVYLASCDSSQKWLDETIGREVKNIIKINSELSDFSPAYCPSGKLFFSSARQGGKEALIGFDGGAEMHRLDQYFIDLTRLESKDQNKKDDIRNFSEINTAMHEGPACFSMDGKTFYFTKTVKGSRNTTNNSLLSTLQVYRSCQDSSGKWSKPESAFFFNSNNYSVGHPSLSADGKKIFYMSDKPGGLGKTDIYYSVMQENGEWSTPVNAGNVINTFGYELFPYINSMNDLYFSSNAHPGMGQLDIFKAGYHEEVCSEVINLKPPLNSIGNDFGIVFDGNNRHGFFSSDRFNGLGAEDIYSFSDELFLQISFVNDSLVFNDFVVYDDIKYKLINETDSVSIALIAENGKFSVPILQSKKYELNASRYGMKYNQVYFSYLKDSVHNNVTYKISSSNRPLRVSGKLFIGIKELVATDANNKEKVFCAAETISVGEVEASINAKGYFIFKADLDFGKECVISSKNQFNE